MTPVQIFWGCGILAGCCMAAAYRKQRKRFLAALLTGAGGGIAALLAAAELAWVAPVTAGSLGFAAVLGIPGVLFLCAVHFLGWL